MEEAERIAREEHGSNKLAVISGIGTRDYYRYIFLFLIVPIWKDAWKTFTIFSYKLILELYFISKILLPPKW